MVHYRNGNYEVGAGTLLTSWSILIQPCQMAAKQQQMASSNTKDLDQLATSQLDACKHSRVCDAILACKLIATPAICLAGLSLGIPTPSQPKQLQLQAMAKDEEPQKGPKVCTIPITSIRKRVLAPQNTPAKKRKMTYELKDGWICR